MAFDSKECEWNDMEVFLAGAPVTKIRGINYKPMQETQPLHGAGNKPISIQRGNKTYEGNVVLLKGSLDDMNDAARAAGFDDLLDADFDIVVTYRAKGIRQLKTDTCVGVVAKELPKGWEQGSKFMECSIPFECLDIE